MFDIEQETHFYQKLFGHRGLDHQWLRRNYTRANGANFLKRAPRISSDPDPILPRYKDHFSKMTPLIILNASSLEPAGQRLRAH